MGRPLMLDVVDDARVRVLTLNRPEALNAFNDELYHLAGRALEEAAVRDDKKIRKAANGSKKELDKAVAETNELVDVWIERIEQSD